MNIEELTIYVLSADGSSYAEFLVGGEPVRLVEYSYVSERMGGTVLSGELRHEECLDGYWTGREFVVLDEGRLVGSGVGAVEKFFLSHIPSSSKSNEDARYVHSLEFRAGRDLLLGGVYFCDAVASGSASAGRYVGNSYEVKFFGTLDEFVSRFNDVLSYRGLSSRFSVSVESGIVGTTESLEVSFDRMTLGEVLGKAVEVWGVPYYFVGDSAVFGSADSEPLVGVEYGVDRELLRVSMNNRGEKIVTRIIGEGGTENVPSYYPNPSPKGTLGVGGTASGVSIVDMPLFARMVGAGDELVYEGRDAGFGSVTLHFGGFTAVSSSQMTSAVVDGESHRGVNVSLPAVPFDVLVSADLSQGFDRGLDVFLTALLGSAEGISDDAELYYVKSLTSQPSEYVTRLRRDVSAKGWTPAVERVEVVAGGVTRQVDFEGLYVDQEYDERDAGLYPPRRLYGVRVDMGAAVASLPSGTSLTTCQVRLVGTLRSEVTWYVPGQVWTFAQFHVASLSATSGFDPAGWYLGDEALGQDLGVVGLRQSGTPVEGTTITQVVLGYVTPTGRLMPSVYRDSGGVTRWYDATDTPPGAYAQAYVNPDTGENYDFENEYDALEPHEHVESFDDVIPSIRNLVDGQGNPLNVLQEVYFDDGYNVRDLLPDGKTLRYSYFFVKLKPLGFNLFDCAIEDGEMAVVMGDGACAGCHFKILVTSAGKNPVQRNANGTLKKEDGYGVIDAGNLQPAQQDTTSNAVWLALYLDDSTFGGGEYGTMPAYDKATGAGPRPVSGDSYVLENILLPQAFFTAAEQELDRRMVRFMWENNADKFDPSVVFSRIYLAQHPDVRASLSERSRLSLTYDGRVYAPLYVSQFTLNVKEGEPLPEILVETKDVVEHRTAGIDEKIASAVGAAMNVIQGSVGGVDLSETDARYLRKDVSDRAEETIVFAKGLEVGDYRAGLAGIGGSVYTNAAGEAIAEFDFLNVRRKATFTEVEVEQIRKVAGTILLSLADLTVSAVEKVSGGWKCWFRTEASDGSAVENGFAVNDQAICRKLQSMDDHYYWRLVTSVGPDWIVLSESDCDAGSDAPRVGDAVVQLGNRTDTSRQSAQILSCYGADSPSYVIYAGINSYSLANRDVSGFVYRETSPGSGTYKPLFFNYGSMLLGDRAKSADYVEYDDANGTMTIKANVVFKAGQTIPGLADLEDEVDGLSDNVDDMSQELDGFSQALGGLTTDVNALTYLKTALPKSDTIIAGGLILSKVIALRDANNVIKSGINGDPSLSSIAAWYGGPMADKEASPTPSSYAQSLFRFDGSGYMAGGKITWGANGAGSIPGVSWSADGSSIIIGGNVKLASASGDTVTELLTALQNLPNTYVDFTSAQTISGFKTFTSGIQIGGATLTWVEGTGGAPGFLRINSALSTTGDQIVGNATPGGGGGGGGVSSLYLLDDVSVASRANGDLLQYNGSVWVNTSPSQLPVATASANGLLSSSDFTKLSGIATGATRVTESTVSGWGFTKNAGTVTSVKVGSTSYNPSSGVVSLPAYPTTLPASDVYAWAKAATKPSYTLDEVTDGSTRKLSDYVLKAGDTMTGDLAIKKSGGGVLSLYGTAHNGNAGEIVFQSMGTQVRNGFKISAVAGYTAYDLEDLVFYTSNNRTTPYSPTWEEAMRIASTKAVSIATSLAIGTTLSVTGLATLSGGANVPSADGRSYRLTGSTRDISFLLGSAGTNRGFYGNTESKWLFYFDASDTISNNGSLRPGSNNAQDLGLSSAYWRTAYVKTIYLASGVYLAYDSTSGCVKITGAGLLTTGDQITGSGSSGGGGGGVTNLYQLDDVSVSTRTSGDVLQYNGSKWVNVAASTIGRIYTAGTGITISGTTISLNVAGAKTALGLDDYVLKATAQTITAKHTFSGGLLLNTATSWTSSDRALYFAADGDASNLRYYYADASKGLTFNPSTGALKAAKFVNRGSSDSEFLLGGGGTVARSTYITAATAAGSYVAKAGDTMSGGLAICLTPNSSYPVNRTKATLIVEDDSGAATGEVRGGNIIISRGYSATANTSAGAISFYGRRLSGGYRNGARIASIASVTGTSYDKQDLAFYVSNNESDSTPTFEEAMRIRADKAVSMNGWLSVSRGGVYNIYINNTASDGTAAGIRFQLGGTTKGGLFVNYDDNLYYSVGTASTGNKVLTSANYDGYALPLAGGTMTGSIKLTNGTYINAASGYAMCGVGSGGETFYCGPGAEITSAFYIRSGNINLTHVKAGTNYTIWDASNSNLSSVDWAANNLTAAGAGTFDRVVITNTSAVAHLTFSRTNWNYIVFPGTGALAISHTSASTANTPAVFSSAGVRPGANSAYNLGHVDTSSSSNNRLWSNIYGENLTLLKASGAAVLTIASLNDNHAAGSILFKSNNSYEHNGFRISTTVAASTSNRGRLSLDFSSSNVTADPYAPSWKRVLRLTYAGNAIIGTSDSNSNLTVYGTFTTTGDQVISSDATKKKNWRDLKYGVADIAKATAGVFDWKDGKGESAGTKAQDWMHLVPQLVHGEEGHMTLAYGQIAMLNTILLARRSEDHESRIKALELENAELRKEIERLRS